jgi:type I restriction enzyme R subunit
LLTKPEIKLSKAEEQEVKKAARELLTVLKKEKLVLDWKKQQKTRAGVRQAIEKVLDQDLPRAYTPELYERKCDLVYQHVFESYYGQGKSLYAVQ